MAIAHRTTEDEVKLVIECVSSLTDELKLEFIENLANNKANEYTREAKECLQSEIASLLNIIALSKG